MSIEKSNYSVLISLVVCFTIFVCSVIGSITIKDYYNQTNMAKNIDSAIAKGIDPIAVKCAYEHSSSSPTCITYALRGK